MIRQLQTVCLAAFAVAFAACAESSPTAPQAARAGSAAAELVALSAPAPTASCTVTQLDQTHYEATATWSGLSATSLEFWQGTAVLAVAVFGHPIRSGSVTDTLSSAPDGARVLGKTIGVKVRCNTAF